MVDPLENKLSQFYSKKAASYAILDSRNQFRGFIIAQIVVLKSSQYVLDTQNYTNFWSSSKYIISMYPNRGHMPQYHKSQLGTKIRIFEFDFHPRVAR